MSFNRGDVGFKDLQNSVRRLQLNIIFMPTFAHGICFAGDVGILLSKCDDLARFVGRSAIVPITGI